MWMRFRPSLLVGALALVVTLSLVLAAGWPGRDAYRYLNVFQEVWNLTRENYVEPVSEDDLLEGAYRGMVASLDAASAFLAPGEEVGVLEPAGPGRAGFELLPSGNVAVIVRVDPGSPAAEAGLHRGDQVWRIGGEPTRLKSWPQLRRAVTGPVGARLDLVVLDGRRYRLRELSLELAAPADGGFLIDRPREGLIRLRITEPDRVEGASLADALRAEMARAPATSVLVDLRGAVGLDVERAGAIAAALGSAGPGFRLVPRSGPERRIDVPDLPSIQLPDARFVLVDGTTAGSAEALAALLRERDAARLCGRDTFGLGALPELIPLSRGGFLLLTTRQVVTAQGTSWADDGLAVDHRLETRVARGDDDGDPLLDAALEWIAAGAPEQPATGRTASGTGEPAGVESRS
ncbi:MAG: hypothetical protein Kow0062_25670 [Acidobacteriota bacterium]